VRSVIFGSVFLFALCGSASADMYIMQPSPQYDHPYRGPLIEHALPWRDARALCGQMVPKIASLSGYVKRPDACAWRAGHVCHIVVPAGRDVPAHETAAYRRHEIGHCNGWSANHSGGR